LAAEVAILLGILLNLALLHSLVDRPEDFDVGLTQRELGRPGSSCPGFDLVHPIEKLVDGSLISARSFCCQLHRSGLDFGDFSNLSTYGRGDSVASSFEYVSAQVFRTLWTAFGIAAYALTKPRLFRWIAAAGLK
jgi:hypothetical protein